MSHDYSLSLFLLNMFLHNILSEEFFTNSVANCNIMRVSIEEKDKAQRSFFLPEEPIETVDVTPVSDEEPIPPTPPVVKGKAKVWKTVQKTYEDEDGFFGKLMSNLFITFQYF